MTPATIYQSSKGPKLIADLPYPYLCNAHAKLVRDEPHRQAEIAAMQARIDAEAIDDGKGDEGAATVAAPAAPLGHNGPPAETPVAAVSLDSADPFEAHRVHIDDLYTEAKNWADGQDIETPEQAAEVNRLIDAFKDAIEAAAESRDEEIKPLTAQVTAVRERYYPLIADTTRLKGIAIRAKAALLAVKTRWMNKVEAERRVEAARLAKEAADKVQVAVQATREAVGDIVATEQAEDLIRDAKASLKVAERVAKPMVGTGMRTIWTTQIANPILAARWAWANHQTECEEFFLTLARRDVQAGARALDGFTIAPERKAA